MKKLLLTVQALALLLPGAPLSAEEYRVPLEKHGSTYTLPVSLNNSEPATFILDTGASHTVISPRLASRLQRSGTQVVEHIAVVTANGRSTLPVVILSSLNIGNYEVRNVRAVVQHIDTRSDSLEGLLGMSALAEVDQLTLFLRKQELLLQTRAGPSR